MLLTVVKILKTFKGEFKVCSNLGELVGNTILNFSFEENNYLNKSRCQKERVVQNH